MGTIRQEMTQMFLRYIALVVPIFQIAGCAYTTPAHQHHSTVEESKMHRIEMITRAPMTVQVLKDGADITATLGVKEIKYNADGTGVRNMIDGTTVPLSWRFSGADQNVLEMTSPRGTSRWE